MGNLPDLTPQLAPLKTQFFPITIDHVRESLATSFYENIPNTPSHLEISSGIPAGSSQNTASS